MAPNYSQVVRSKSSNSAMTTKSDRPKTSRNKKTRSAEFGSREKASGVFVEKKPMELSLDADNQRKRSRAPPRQRQNKNELLTSILGILSKCTASTQYSNAIETAGEIETPTRVKKTTYTRDNVVEPTQSERTRKKPKYKSRILNKVSYRQEKDSLVVIKGRKELVQTPSQRSYKELTDSNRLLNSFSLNTHEDKDSKEKRVGINVNKVKTEKKIHLNTEPDTLVSKNNNKSDNKLFSFFVDILESTFQNYNIKEGVIDPTQSEDVSKIHFEIDETVAKKLELAKYKESVDDLDKQCCQKKSYNVIDDDMFNDRNSSRRTARNRSPGSYRSRYPCSRGNPQGTKSLGYRSPTRSYKRISASFASQQFKVASPKASNDTTKKSFSKKGKKQTLLTILKKQLTVNDDTFEEPQTIYEALKVLARNKRDCRKVLTFENEKYTGSGFDPLCWKRSRILSSVGKSAKRKRQSKFHENDHHRSNVSRSFSKLRFAYPTYRAKSNYSTHFDDIESDSQQSVEVQEYNYEPRVGKNKPIINNKILYADDSNASIKGPSKAMSKLAGNYSKVNSCKVYSAAAYRSISQIMFGIS